MQINVQEVFSPRLYTIYRIFYTKVQSQKLRSRRALSGILNSDKQDAQFSIIEFFASIYANVNNISYAYANKTSEDNFKHPILKKSTEGKSTQDTIEFYFWLFSFVLIHLFANKIFTRIHMYLYVYVPLGGMHVCTHACRMRASLDNTVIQYQNA